METTYRIVVEFVDEDTADEKSSTVRNRLDEYLCDMMDGDSDIVDFQIREE